jgi:dTDP-4-dehydrorhamnose 3,5-epimerase-like enzyme
MILSNAQVINSQDAKLSVLEGKLIPFKVKRVYYIYNVPNGSVRGFHAHKTLEQLLISLGGRIDVKMDDGQGDKKIYVLDSPEKILYVGPSYWREMTWKSPNTTLLVLASQEYNPDDYIRDYDDFIKFAAKERWN